MIGFSFESLQYLKYFSCTQFHLICIILNDDECETRDVESPPASVHAEEDGEG